MYTILKYDVKLLLLLLVLVAIPCIFLSSFAIQAISGKKVIIEQNIEQTYTLVVANTRKQVIENVSNRIKNIDEILTKQSLWQNSPPVSILNTTLKNSLFKNFYLLDNELDIIYPQGRPKSTTIKETLPQWENFPLFETAYIFEFQKKDFDSAISEYQKIVTELQEQKLEPLGQALLGIARCHLKAERYDRALQVYQNLYMLFKNQQDIQSLTFSLDAQMQIAEIYNRQKETFLYYQTLLEVLNTLIFYEYCINKSQYLYYSQQIQDILNLLPQNSSLSVEEREKLLDIQSNILERQRRFIEQEKEIKSLQQNVITLWKSQPQNIPTSGYIPFLFTNQQQLIYHRQLEQDSFKGYVIYNIDLNIALQEIIIPTLKEQELEKDVFLTIVQQNGTPLFGVLQSPFFSVVSQPLLPIFPFWQIAIYIKNVQSLEDLSQYQSQLYFLGLITIILVLSVGIYVVIMTFLREVQNARFKSDFISNVTHELKTPLTSIKMFVETLLMERAKTEDERKECLQIISAESDRLSRLIDRILDLARIQQRRKIFHFKPTNFEILITSCVDDFRKQVPESACKIEIKIDPKLPEIAVDRETMHEAILNLLSNAYKYNDKVEKLIFIQIKLDIPSILAISIRDNGIGIPRHEFHRIFQKFYRIENIWTQRIPGSGLGLALVESIIQAHKGEIEVQSKINIGTEFIIFLPISKNYTENKQSDHKQESAIIQ